jgi:DEAD/DEAH box helicase domain-containing protein
VLRHHDDLGKADKDHQHLPVIHCRDCHATGWGATLPKTSPNQLQQDLRLFYSAFFGEDVSTRFLFPATPNADRRVFERKQVCPKCGTLHQMTQRGCSHCGHETLLAVDITANLKEATRNGAKFTKSHHDCPYCGGHRTLTIVGSQAASLGGGDGGPAVQQWVQPGQEAHRVLGLGARRCAPRRLSWRRAPGA